MQINISIPKWLQPFLYGFAVVIPFAIITAIFGPSPLAALVLFILFCAMAGIIGAIIMLIMGKEPFDF